MLFIKTRSFRGTCAKIHASTRECESERMKYVLNISWRQCFNFAVSNGFHTLNSTKHCAHTEAHTSCANISSISFINLITKRCAISPSAYHIASHHIALNIKLQCTTELFERRYNNNIMGALTIYGADTLLSLFSKQVLMTFSQNSGIFYFFCRHLVSFGAFVRFNFFSRKFYDRWKAVLHFFYSFTKYSRWFHSFPFPDADKLSNDKLIWLLFYQKFFSFWHKFYLIHEYALTWMVNIF